jgi:hypothetical protein
MTISALVLMLAFPETPTGKWLHRILVEAPSQCLMEFSWAKLGRTLLLGGAFALIAFMGPEMMLLLAASGMDAAALLEVMLIIWLAAVSGGVTAAWRTARRIVTGVVRLVGRVSRNRSRAPRRRRQPQRKNDDQGEPGWALA